MARPLCSHLHVDRRPALSADRCSPAGVGDRIERVAATESSAHRRDSGTGKAWGARQFTNERAAATVLPVIARPSLRRGSSDCSVSRTVRQTVVRAGSAVRMRDGGTCFSTKCDCRSPHRRSLRALRSVVRTSRLQRLHRVNAPWWRTNKKLSGLWTRACPRRPVLPPGGIEIHVRRYGTREDILELASYFLEGTATRVESLGRDRPRRAAHLRRKATSAAGTHDGAHLAWLGMPRARSPTSIGIRDRFAMAVPFVDATTRARVGERMSGRPRRSGRNRQGGRALGISLSHCRLLANAHRCSWHRARNATRYRQRDRRSTRHNGKAEAGTARAVWVSCARQFISPSP